METVVTKDSVAAIADAADVEHVSMGVPASIRPRGLTTLPWMTLPCCPIACISEHFTTVGDTIRQALGRCLLALPIQTAIAGMRPVTSSKRK